MNHSKKIAILLFFILLNNAFSKPKVDLYIESLCQDSIAFLSISYAKFLKQPDHNDIADVNIYPYGNAKETGESGKYNYECQHGPNECYGNLYYACAIAFLAPQTAHDFIVCMESNIISHGRSFDFTAYHCIASQPDLLSKIQNCIYNPAISIPIMHQIAQKTDNLVPKHTHVPWVVVDDIYNEDVENKIIKDMYGYLKNEVVKGMLH